MRSTSPKLPGMRSLSRTRTHSRVYTEPTFASDCLAGDPGLRPARCFQSWATQNMTTFIPKYLSDLGQSASVYGFIAALFMGGTTLGNLTGGNLADRYGARRISFISLSLAAVPLFLIPNVGFSGVYSCWFPWLASGRSHQQHHRRPGPGPGPRRHGHGQRAGLGADLRCWRPWHFPDRAPGRLMGFHTGFPTVWPSCSGLQLAGSRRRLEEDRRSCQ